MDGAEVSAWLPSRPSASRLSTGAFCWLSWSITTSLSNTSQQPHNHGDSNPWPFSRSRLAVDVRQHGLPSGCPLPLWISSPLIYLIFLTSSTSETNGQSSSPEHVPSLRLLCSSVIFLLASKKNRHLLRAPFPVFPLSCHRSDTRCAADVSPWVPLRSSVLWFFVVSCGPGWASTSSDNI